MKKYFSLDIDGPISNYTKCWCDFINMQQNINFQSKEEAKKYLGKEKYYVNLMDPQGKKKLSSKLFLTLNKDS